MAWRESNQTGVWVPRPGMPVRADVWSILPWVLIPYDSLTHLLGADPAAVSQTLPLTALLAFPYVLFRGLGLRATNRSSVTLALLLMTAIVGLATMGNLAVEAAFGGLGDLGLRNATAARQGLSLLLGLATFFMFQDALVRLGLQRAMCWLVLGGVPSLGLAITQVAAGEFRVQGFSSEPSHLADMLVWAFLPACFIAALPRTRGLIAAGLAFATLVATFSTTGLLKAFGVLACYFASRGQVVRALAAVALIAVVSYGVLNLWPDNYVFLMYSVMTSAFEATGDLVTGSFIDRFFGFAGPISMLAHPHAWLGFGLGGDSVYFDRLFDPATAHAIREVKGEIASISSLQGKMLMYAGAVGYVAYLAAWVAAWRSAPAGHAARFVIPALFLGSLFSLGPLFLPYVWLWLAVGATATSPKARLTTLQQLPGGTAISEHGHRAHR